jgi:hypothetical protein
MPWPPPGDPAPAPSHCGQHQGGLTHAHSGRRTWLALSVWLAHVRGAASRVPPMCARAQVGLPHTLAFLRSRRPELVSGCGHDDRCGPAAAGRCSALGAGVPLAAARWPCRARLALMRVPVNV